MSWINDLNQEESVKSTSTIIEESTFEELNSDSEIQKRTYVRSVSVSAKEIDNYRSTDDENMKQLL